MLSILFCGYSLTCQIDHLKDHFARPRYPPDVAVICQYFEEQKSELPEYCKWKSETFIPRRRSEF